VKPGVPWSETVREMGSFKADDLNLGVLGENNALAVKLMDQAGWQ
jgi:iron(III) transport system substrate-binding protein